MSAPDFATYPVAMVNITNKCNFRCEHCFIYRESNPNAPKNEMKSSAMLEKLSELQKRHKIETMLWMGGEPLLRPDVLREGVKIFPKNHVTTNGTLDLLELPGCLYVVSLDGPPEINDAIRGKNAFGKVMEMLSQVPDKFGSAVMSQCVVTKSNEEELEELVELLRPTRIEGMTFSFYVPRQNDDSKHAWRSTKERDKAVQEVFRLKRKYPDFIWNNSRALELTLSENCKPVTDNCPSKKFILPLYLEGDEFVRPFCCYGNDVNCDLCGAWVVFSIAEKVERSGGGYRSAY